MNAPEKRKTFRVRESLCVKYDVLSDSQFQQKLQQYASNTGIRGRVSYSLTQIDSRLREELKRLPVEFGTYRDCLNLLNEKLDLLASSLPEIRVSRSELATLPPQSCETSAEAIAFSSTEELPVGTRLELQLLFTSDQFMVETLATVVRTREPIDQSNPFYSYGIVAQYAGMSSEVRESLIQHMFSSESETLRLRRLSTEAL